MPTLFHKIYFFHFPGNIPVIQLNYAALSFESPFDRDTVENCVREILGAVSRGVSGKKNVELTFTGIGRLTVRDSRVKMRFYKEFINQMDGTGKLLDSMQNVSRMVWVNLYFFSSVEKLSHSRKGKHPHLFSYIPLITNILRK